VIDESTHDAIGGAGADFDRRAEHPIRGLRERATIFRLPQPSA